MTDIPEELVAKGAYALHQACIDRWAQIEPGTHAGITKHPPETHRDSARAVLAAVLPDYHREVHADYMAREDTIRADVRRKALEEAEAIALRCADTTEDYIKDKGCRWVAEEIRNAREEDGDA